MISVSIPYTLMTGLRARARSAPADRIVTAGAATG